MVRVSKNLQVAAELLLCAALVGGCSSSEDGADLGTKRANLISFSPMYSAFDGTHEYAVTPSVPSAAEGSKDSDPVMASTIKWEIDNGFVKRDEFPELTAAVKLTTKKAGKTNVKVTAKTIGGTQIWGEAELTISPAQQNEWDAGEARYNNGMMIQFMRPTMAAAGEGTCGLPVNIEIPKMSACGNCHAATSAITVEHTPTQTAGYSNEQLVNIFTTGAKPAGGTFNSPFLRSAPMPDCIYAAFHTWEMTDDEKKGIIWKLRSIAPKVQEDIDFARLAMQARAMMMTAPAMP
ncbi:MAG TPA: hypothetical protein VFN67_21180 [Polyangiales bacterium]|nr:hypothetical protein [Polyangiales bacterium]